MNLIVKLILLGNQNLIPFSRYRKSTILGDTVNV